jgi:hypothetical protein
MSSKKDDKKKGKKDKEKDKEKERMAEEEARKEQERLEAQQRSTSFCYIVGVLEKSGILDAYEYFLRAICKNGLPEANIFEFAAQQILKYQKKMKVKDAKLDKIEKIEEKSPEKPRAGSIEKL